MSTKYAAILCGMLHKAKSVYGYASGEALQSILPEVVNNARLLLTFCKLQGHEHEVLRDTMYIPTLKIGTSTFLMRPLKRQPDLEGSTDAWAIFETLYKYHSPFRVFNTDIDGDHEYAIRFTFKEKEVPGVEQITDTLDINASQKTFSHYQGNLNIEALSRLSQVYHKVMVNSPTLIAI